MRRLSASMVLYLPHYGTEMRAPSILSIVEGFINTLVETLSFNDGVEPTRRSTIFGCRMFMYHVIIRGIPVRINSYQTHSLSQVHIHTKKKSMKEAELTTNNPRFGVFSLLRGLLPSVFSFRFGMHYYVVPPRGHTRELSFGEFTFIIRKLCHHIYSYA